MPTGDFHKLTKYHFLMEALEKKGKGKMTVFGHSMEPIISSGATLEYEKCEEYEVGDIVFCKVRGRFIDAHKITKKKTYKNVGHTWYMIANNHGHENGWTRQVYGRVKL